MLSRVKINKIQVLIKYEDLISTQLNTEFTSTLNCLHYLCKRIHILTLNNSASKCKYAFMGEKLFQITKCPYLAIHHHRQVFDHYFNSRKIMVLLKHSVNV